MGKGISGGAPRVVAGLTLLAAFGMREAHAGNEANFVLYSQYTEPAGEIEINVYNDFSRGAGSLPRYSAQQVEIEYAFTNKLVSALYVDAQKSPDESYQFGAWKFETRYRLFEYGAVFLNPMLYVEYATERPANRYISEVLGRTDTPEAPGGPRTEHNIETKLILGEDIGKNFDVAFNWINEANLDTGHWEFGYAAGLNYSLYRVERNKADPWSIRSVKLGAELYGGLGDNWRGLTLDPGVTQQYAGLNLKTAFSNDVNFMIGIAAGLTSPSEHALLRLQLGYEFK
jgi:hypothetical protein